MVIAELNCEKCEFSLRATTTGFPYVVWDDDVHGLRHPLEVENLNKLTGLTWKEAIAKGVLGRKPACICFACSAKFSLDIDRDVKRCPECASYEVRTFVGSINALCPACHQGTLEHSFIGIA